MKNCGASDKSIVQWDDDAQTVRLYNLKTRRQAGKKLSVIDSKKDEKGKFMELTVKIE